MDIFGLGAPEVILFAFVLLLFFGKKRLPGLAQGIGQSIKELRDGLTRGFEETDKDTKGKKSWHLNISQRDVTSNIVVDTTSAATDTIDYVVTDSAGLTATSTRTVIVSDPAVSNTLSASASSTVAGSSPSSQ